jgi:hypothetical protein
VTDPEPGKRTIARARQAKLERQVTQMRLAGATFGQIAETLKVSVATVKRAFDRAMARSSRLNESNAELMREMELQRLDALILAHYGRATDRQSPVFRSADIVLSAMKMRQELLGLKAPQKVDIMVSLQAIAQSYGVPVEELIQAAQEAQQTARAALPPDLKALPGEPVLLPAPLPAEREVSRE